MHNLKWLGIRDDYRTLTDLEEVNVVDKSTNVDEDEDDEWSAIPKPLLSRKR